MTEVRAIAPAKLNLGLEVIGRRPDGYHDIATIYQTIDLCDTLTVLASDKLTLLVDDPALRDESNLALRAAKALRERFSIWNGAEIRLQKEIPVAAGLGGASSDAAATLRALSVLWGLDPPTNDLFEIASGLGSDVPFLLAGGTALGKGRGEIIRRLSGQVSCWVVVATPKLAIEEKTATMFRMLDDRDYTSGGEVLALAQQIERGEPLTSADLPNTFTGHAFKRWPILRELSEQLQVAGAPNVSLSGSGPSLFTLVKGESDAVRVRDQLSDRVATNMQVYACKTISHVPMTVRDNRQLGSYDSAL